MYTQTLQIQKASQEAVCGGRAWMQTWSRSVNLYQVSVKLTPGISVVPQPFHMCDSVHSISKRRLPGTGTTVGVWESCKRHSIGNRLGKKQTKCTAWFPDLHRLQILIPCSTPKWWGKALEIASLGMMSEGNTLWIDHLSAPSKTDTATQSTYEGTSLLHKQQT